MIDPALLARIASLPPDARARARVIIDQVAPWAGRLLSVDSEAEAGGRVHVTLRFEHEAFDFVALAEPAKDSAP